MIKPVTKKYIAGAVAIVVVASALLVFLNRGPDNYRDKYEGVDLSDSGDLGRDDTYEKYLEKHSKDVYPDKDVEISYKNLKESDGVKVLSEYEGQKNIVLADEGSLAEWEFDVEKSGMYEIYMEYYPVKSRGVDIERKLYINNEIPFFGADSLTFSRLWTDKSAPAKDNRGNELRPTQIENASWTGAYFKDHTGYYSEPYLFYFQKGKNKIGLKAVNEPVAIKSLSLKAVKEEPSYDEYIAASPKIEQADAAKNFKDVIQGEASTLRSSPSLYATYDRSSSKTEPYSASKIRLNMMGGYAWRVPGQWIEWKISVPEDGYYSIYVKGRQNYNRGFVSNRILYIDGEIPFKEAKQISFKYANEWKSVTLKDSSGNPCKFYMTKGEHTVRLEVSLGDMGEILNEMEDSIYRLNSMYRKILVLTGTNPDQYRDYKIEKVYPDVVTQMGLESKRLYKIVDELVAYSGQKGSQVGALQTLALQLERFAEHPEKIPVSLTSFRDNVSSLGTLILSLSESPLDIDSITVVGENQKPDNVSETFIDKAGHEIRSFFMSFFGNYNTLGNVYSGDDVLDVWLLSGRDQGSVLKNMIDNDFTSQSGIKVNLKLVDAATLLNAVIAGKGPDVALSVGQGEPVNYALRGAAEDLTQFEDYKEVFNNFYPSAYEPYRFNGGIYAVPETQTYDVMFYRKDILDELGVKVPQTWQELIEILPVIQQNNMTIAMPSVEKSNLTGIYSMLYQNGGSLYDESHKKTLIDSESGVKAFQTYTKFFTNYGLPVDYDFVNRFRSGEMPLGIQDYSTCNTLVVFAPEIRGLWDFTLVPGTLKSDGTIDRSCPSGGICSLMLKQSDEAKKKSSWEFLKWWAKTDTQVNFGREMESVLGSSARYAAANREAFEQLSWSHEQIEVLKEQRECTIGIPEIAGGYYTSRHVSNAVRKIVNQHEDPREAVLDYAITINKEIEKKRIEFGLDKK